MAGTFASILSLIIIIALVLILLTALDSAYAHPLFHPSPQNVRHLVSSLEDLLLPMGSFPSELLHPWAPKELCHESNHTTLQLPMTPAPEIGRPHLDSQSPTSKPIHDDGRVKPLAVPSPTTSTLTNGESNSTMMPPSAFPIPNVNRSEPSAELSMSMQAAINVVSNPEASFDLMFSSGLPPSAMSRWIRRQTDNVELIAADVHSFTNPPTSGHQPPVLDKPSDQTSSGSPRAQQSPKEDLCNRRSAVDVPLPEQTSAEIDALGKYSDTMSEEVQKDEKQEEEASSVAAEKASTEGKASEQQDENSTVAVEEVPTKSQDFEMAIRGLVDPDGSSGSTLEDLVALVAGLKGRAEAEEKLKSEIIRLSREEEDLRHDWIDQREYIESVINGQNNFVAEKDLESNRLFVENSRLDRENSALKEQLKDQEEQLNREIENLEAKKQYAENAETTALAEVEERIGREKLRHERERLAADDRHRQEMNSEKCQKNEISKELAWTQEHLVAVKRNYETALKKKDRTISGLKTEISHMEPAVAAAVERETSTKDRLESELKHRVEDKDGEIGNLQEQLRKAKDEARSLGNSLYLLKHAAEIRQVKFNRLSTSYDEEKVSLREQRDHLVGDLKREKKGLERTIRDDEAVIDSLQGKISKLESGHEVQSLQSQLRALKKKLQTSHEETKELHKGIEAQESRKSEEVKKASDENKGLKNQLADLKNQLAEAARSKEGQDRTIQDYKEQKEKSAREITDTVRERDQQIQGLQTQYQEILREKDGMIQGLQTKHQEILRKKDGMIQGLQTQHQEILREKDGMSQGLQRTAQLEDERRQMATDYEILLKKKNEEIMGLQELVKNAQGMEVSNDREIEEGQAKAAADKAAKAAKDAADAEKMTLQHQLDDERQASRNAQDKAIETETNMGNEIIALKSAVSKYHLASNQTSQEAHHWLIQANNANNLLLEVGKTGLIKGSPEHSTFCELNDAKFALHKVNCEFRKPNTTASKSWLVSLIGDLNVNEERIQQFSSDTPRLVEQVQKTNARLRRLQKIVDADGDVQKDAIFEALHTDIPQERVIRKPRTLKRPDNPSSGILPQHILTGGQARSALHQSQQTHELPGQLHNPHLSTVQQNLQPRSQAATPSAQIQGNSQAQSRAPANGPAFASKPVPKRDQRVPFAELLASVSSTR